MNAPVGGLADLERVYLLPRLNALLNGTAFCCLALSPSSVSVRLRPYRRLVPLSSFCMW